MGESIEEEITAIAVEFGKLNATITQLRASLAAVTQERDELKAKFQAVEARARLTFELHAMDSLLDESASKGSQRLSQIIVAWDEADRRAAAAEKERDHLRAEKLLILAQVTEYDTLIRGALQLPPETEWRVEFYAGEIRRLVGLAAVNDIRPLGILPSPHPAEGRTYEQGAEALAAENAQLRSLLGEARAWIEDAKEPASIGKAFNEGAEDMRERAAEFADSAFGYHAGNHIRALPTQPKEAKDE